MPRWLVVVSASVVLAASCSSGGPRAADGTTTSRGPTAEGTTAGTPQDPVLQDLSGIETIAARFDEDAGAVRLVLLVAPT